MVEYRMSEVEQWITRGSLLRKSVDDVVRGKRIY